MAWNQSRQKSASRLSQAPVRLHDARNSEDLQPSDVREARRRLGMTQPAFAECFGVALPTLRKWEQGTRRPDGSARVLLRVIQTEPDAVRRALAHMRHLT